MAVREHVSKPAIHDQLGQDDGTESQDGIAGGRHRSTREIVAPARQGLQLLIRFLQNCRTAFDLFYPLDPVILCQGTWPTVLRRNEQAGKRRPPPFTAARSRLARIN
jgi:hypothetical protein